MIFYNNLLAKWFLRKGKKHCFMLGGLFFTRYKYLEIWEDMDPCKAVLGMLFVDVATRFGLVVVLLMVVDVASLCDLPHLLLVGEVLPLSLCL